MKMTVKVEGLKDLGKSLEGLGKRTSATVFRRALKNAAEPMRALASQYAPAKTHRLEEDIHISTRAKGADAGKKEYRETLRAGGAVEDAVSALRTARRGLKGTVTLYIGPSTRTAWYGKWQEFGTVKNDPDPFMRPAFDKEALPTIQRLKPLLKEEIRKAAARAARRAAKRTGGAS